ncbi:hypothetical protein A3844_11600 [Paenibacillus helianthi]|uniref:DUF3199 family protein n=1 Tax=Paenibacillus helianthi TaxID=1349432 RepID=A0ABX3ENB7_9BACL|nr:MULTISPECIES: hypothetical protein [Paenibacillus]OKP86659.1 hypothetical protein A3844_11600 [Paenibacillus helianthi]OKP91501.1 hypothetical protein A3842_02830 [Paenibacillus sp. P3E]
MLTTTLLKIRSRVSAVQEETGDQLEQYIDDAQTRIELYLPVPFPAMVDKQLLLAWVKLAESLALQDSEEYLASAARGYSAESDGAWTYTRLAVEGKTTGNADVDSILFLWVKKQQSGPDDGNITAYLL